MPADGTLENFKATSDQESSSNCAIPSIMNVALRTGRELSSTQYENLLGTITELQTDLQRTVQVASDLKAENADLRRNCEDLKASLIRTRTRYAETRTSLLKQLQLTTERERAVDDAVAKWKSQLDSRTRELEEMRASLALQDLDQLRNQLRQELEETHSTRTSKMEAEVRADVEFDYETVCPVCSDEGV